MYLNERKFTVRRGRLRMRDESQMCKRLACLYIVHNPLLRFYKVFLIWLNVMYIVFEIPIIDHVKVSYVTSR